MGIRGLAWRLGKLEPPRPRFDPANCPGDTTVTVFNDEPIPADAAPCALCGEPHVLHVVEVVVADAGQAGALIGELVKASGVVRQ